MQDGLTLPLGGNNTERERNSVCEREIMYTEVKYYNSV